MCQKVYVTYVEICQCLERECFGSKLMGWIVRNAQPQYECRVGAGAPLVSTVNASYPEMRSYPQFLPLLDTNVKTDVQDVLSNLTHTASV